MSCDKQEVVVQPYQDAVIATDMDLVDKIVELTVLVDANANLQWFTYIVFFQPAITTDTGSLSTTPDFGKLSVLIF